MLTKRIIPCLDIKNSTTVKGIKFDSLKKIGDPIALALCYSKEGADELVFLDINATNEKRSTLVDKVKEIASELCIPFTIGGGISSVYDVENLLNAGADKISINSAAFNNPKLLDELVKIFGSQSIVLAIDIKFLNNEWWVYINGGRIKTCSKALDWAKEGSSRGVGEILLTSITHDGLQKGFALSIIKEFSEKLTIPIIASGGGGKIEDFYEVFKTGKADAALASSIFHYKKISIKKLKFHLKSKGIDIRI